MDQIVANCVANQRLEGLECSEEDLAAARRIVTGETTLAEAGEQEIVHVTVDDAANLITVTVKEQG